MPLGHPVPWGYQLLLLGDGQKMEKSPREKGFSRHRFTKNPISFKLWIRYRRRMYLKWQASRFLNNRIYIAEFRQGNKRKIQIDKLHIFNYSTLLIRQSPTLHLVKQQTSWPMLTASNIKSGIQLKKLSWLTEIAHREFRSI